MPSQKTRSKEDTWTTDELSKALNKTSERRHHRDRDEDRKKDRINSEDKHRRPKEEESDRRRRHRDEGENGADLRLTEEERDKQREERRRKREGKDGSSSKEKKGKEITFRGKSDRREIELNDVEENDSDDRRKRHHGDRDRRHRDDADPERRHHDREERHRDRDERHRDEDDDRERRRRHRDDDNDHEKRRKQKDEDDDLERRRKHRDDGDREKKRKHRDEDPEEERERRRRERRQEKEAKEEEERRRHEEKKERRKEKDRDRDRDRDREKDRDRDRDRDRNRDRHEREERSDKHRDRKDRDRHRETEEEKEERRKKEREERHREKEEKRSSRHKEEEVKKEEEEDEYNYEEDFEDYEEDFEEEDDEGEAASQPRNVKETIQKKTGAGSRLDYSDSEVNEVLRALDAENERLLNSSSRSPQVSAKYGRDNDRGDSNNEDDSDDGYQKSYQPRMDRPRTAINFVSAKQRAVSRKTASKTMQRGKDLLKMIELDHASFDIMDLPPVNEYDLYIRAFGSSNTRQAYVQTNEDNIDRDIQTEEVDVRQKWTQHPAEDFKGCGRGDGEKDVEEEEESQSKINREQDLGRLNAFLEKAGQVIAILLEERKEEEAGSKGQSQTHINVSEGYTQLDILPILQDRHVIYSHFSPVQPSLLLTVYSPSPQVSEDNPVSKRGVICVWNTNEPSYPQKILVCSSQPRCCCFSPIKPSLVFAGMQDGSIAMWDLREPPSIHRSTVVNEESYSLRYPTYDTASVLKEENHHSPVSSIQPIYSYIDVSKTDAQQSQASEDTSSGLSFQLVSTEETAVLHFWVVAEIGRPEMAGSESDLGLAPGAGVKLLKSSTLAMSNQSKFSTLPDSDSNELDSRLQAGIRALDMSLMPNDPNHFYISTDSGCILHGIRFGKRTFPRAHSPVIETIVDVVSIDFSPFDQPCFLAGCSDGTFSLYHTKSENPLITWPSITKGQAVQCVRWSRCRPCVFYVLDVTSTLYVFDLLEGDVQPKHIETISKERITSFSLTTVLQPDGLGSSVKNAQMLFSYDGGKTEIHTITKSLRVPDQLETDYLGSYLQRF